MAATPFSNSLLAEEELQAKAGLFVNRITGMVWNIHVKDAAIVVQVPPHFTFQLNPLSGTKFIPIDSQVKLEVEFETVGQKCLMYVYTKNHDRATFEQLLSGDPLYD